MSVRRCPSSVPLYAYLGNVCVGFARFSVTSLGRFFSHIRLEPDILCRCLSDEGCTHPSLWDGPTRKKNHAPTNRRVVQYLRTRFRERIRQERTSSCRHYTRNSIILVFLVFFTLFFRTLYVFHSKYWKYIFFNSTVSPAHPVLLHEELAERRERENRTGPESYSLDEYTDNTLYLVIRYEFSRRLRARYFIEYLLTVPIQSIPTVPVQCTRIIIFMPLYTMSSTIIPKR